MSLYLFPWSPSWRFSATTMTSGIGVVRVAAREKDSALEGLENVGPDDVDGLDKDVGPEDVEGLENEVNDGAEGGADEDGGLAACITQLAPLSWVKLFLHSCFWKYGKWQLILHKRRRRPSSIQINTRWLLLNIEDPGLWHKYFLKSSFLIFFSNNLIDLATQNNWILTPFQINFQGLTVNFVGEMEDLGSFGQQTIQKGFVAACNIILYQISENWKEILVNVLQTPGLPPLTRQTCYATRALTLLIENWWHIQSSLSLGTHGGPWLIFCLSREYQLFVREACSLDITMLIAAQSNKEEHKQKTRKGCWIIYASSSQTMHLHPFCPHSQSLIKHLHNILLPALYYPCSIILGYIAQHFHITIISSSAPLPSEAVFWLSRSRSRGLDTDHENCCHESWDRDPGPRARLMSQASLQTLSCAGFSHFIVIFRLSDKSFMVQKICKSEDDLLLTVIELDAAFLSQNIFYLLSHQN